MRRRASLPPTSDRCRHVLPTFRVKVTASYGPIMPSLADLTGEPPAGYDAVRAFAGNGRPRGWFVDEHDEFSPTLVILGTVYDLDADGEWPAQLEAKTRFAAELARHGIPLPALPIHAEIVD